MAFPPPTLPTNRTNATPQQDNHPDDHNRTNAAVNDIVQELDDRTKQIRLDNANLSLTSTDHSFQIGDTALRNLVMDNNDIQVRESGGPSWLRINSLGGGVLIGSPSDPTTIVGDLECQGQVDIPGAVTVAAAENVNWNPSNGRIRVSSSSARFKRDIEDLDDERRDAVLGMRPVWFRTVGTDDPDDWSFYGFIAEEVAQIDERLVHWEPDPTTGDLIPQGVQYRTLTVHLLALVQDLTARVAALEAAG